MNIYAPIILCFVPFVTTFLLFTILVPKISVVKESIASLAGLLALIPIVLVQFFIPGMNLFGQSRAISILLYSVIFLGLVEEVFKALMLFIVGSKGCWLKHWFCYSLLAGLIFGSFESVIYFRQSLELITNRIVPISLIYQRMFTAVLIHTVCSGLGGLTVFYKKNIRRNLSPLFSAIIIHGLYDYFVSIDTPVKYFAGIVILFAIMECRVHYIRAREELAEKNSSSTKISDPNKTLEMPKKAAIVIPGRTTVKVADDIVVEAVSDENTEDFAAIEREAKTELKAAKKTRSTAKKSAGKKAAEKKLASEKTAVSEKKVTAKKAPAKKTASVKKTAVKKSAAEKTTAVKKSAARKTETTKTAVPKKPAKKTPTKKTAAKKDSAEKTSSAKTKTKK